MEKKYKITFKYALSFLAIFVIFPISYFAQKYHTENIYKSADFIVSSSFLLAIILGLFFFAFLCVVPEVKVRPYLVLAYIVLSISGEVGYFLVEKVDPMDFYLYWPELSLIYSAIVYTVVLFLTNYFVWKKNSIYIICPYICGALYGVFLGVAAMSWVLWALMWHNAAKPPVTPPHEAGWQYVSSTIAFWGIILLALACFAVTLIFNIRIFKKTPRTVVNVISEILLPVLTTFPSAMLFNDIVMLII